MNIRKICFLFILMLNSIFSQAAISQSVLNPIDKLEIKVGLASDKVKPISLPHPMQIKIFPICTNSALQELPDIYMYDFATGEETLITKHTDGSDQSDPAIYENKIVFEDNRNGGTYPYKDIYMAVIEEQ